MKFILFLCFFITTHISSATDEILDINGTNLTLYALKNSSDDVIEQYALHTLKTERVKEYFKVYKNKEKSALLIQDEMGKLKEKLATIDKAQKFKLTKSFSFTNYSEFKSTLSAGSVLTSNVIYKLRKNDMLKALPQYFFILIPNLDILNDIKVNKNSFKRYQSYWVENNRKDYKQLYIEIVFSFEAFQNNQDFQAVIKKIDLYTSRAKKTLLASKSELRDLTKISKTWMLTDGFTNPLIGIHGFQFSRHRLQDPISLISPLKEICKENKKIGPHHVYVCTKPFTQNTDLIISYLGGKVAQIDMIALNTLTKSEVTQIKHDLKIYLKVPTLEIDYNVIQWNDFAVDFKLYSDAFLNKSSLKSNYNNIFETESTAKNRTLILTMMATDTKELLKNLGVKL